MLLLMKLSRRAWSLWSAPRLTAITDWSARTDPSAATTTTPRSRGSYRQRQPELDVDELLTDPVQRRTTLGIDFKDCRTASTCGIRSRSRLLPVEGRASEDALFGLPGKPSGSDHKEQGDGDDYDSIRASSLASQGEFTSSMPRNYVDFMTAL